MTTQVQARVAQLPEMIVPQARKETFLFIIRQLISVSSILTKVFVSSRQRLLRRPCPEASLKEYRASTPCVSFSKEPGNNYFRFCQVLTMSMKSFCASCPLICPTRCLSSSSNIQYSFNLSNIFQHSSRGVW